MNRYKPLSIEDVGLQKWLDDGKAADKWEYGYKDFVEQRYKLKLKKTHMADIWGVHRGTMKKWWALSEGDDARA